MTRPTKSRSPAIGIDLGTWKCCVAVVREGKVEIIENERSNKTTPSYVAFTATERLVGEDAKLQVALNPTNTVFGVKRIIGRSFEDQFIQRDMKYLPFTVTHDEHERPRIPVQYREQKKFLTPELVSGMMLDKMKRIAESHLGCEVRDAVISVPAYFNNAQRQATKDAGAIAGLNVLGLINEPTAAALAYRDNKARVEPHNVLIFDLGGGTLDVAVIGVNESGVEVKGVCGDAEFGGTDIDVILVKQFEEEFIINYGEPVLQYKKCLERLRTASEKAKNTLTILPKANIQVDSLIGDIDFNVSIKRSDFEQLYCTVVKEKIETVLKNVLKQASLQRLDINEVVLIGGTTRIPRVQSILKEFFGGKALNRTVNPDEAVAHGAALHAALLAQASEAVQVYVSDMFQVPPSTEMERVEGKFRNYRAIPKESFYILNCSIQDEIDECDKSEDFFSHKETIMKKHNLNSFGIFDIFTRRNANLKETRELELGCLTESEIQELTIEVRQFAKDDEELKEGVTAMNDLEAFCFQTKALVANSRSIKQKIAEDELQVIVGNCDEIICWLDDNDSETKTVYKCKKRELCSLILSIMKKTHVEVDDFHGADDEWFKEISHVLSEQLLCKTITHAHQKQINSSGLPTQPRHQHQCQAHSSHSAQNPQQHEQSNLPQTAHTSSKQEQSNSSQPTHTPTEQEQSTSSQPTHTPTEQDQSNSSRPTHIPKEKEQSNSPQPTHTPKEKEQSNSAQPTHTPTEQEQSNSSQPTHTPTEQKQANSPRIICAGVQRLGVTPAAETNDLDDDLSANAESNYDKLGFSRSSETPHYPRMKLPNTVLYPVTPSYTTIFPEHFRNYYGPSPYFSYPQTDHCNSTDIDPDGPGN